MCQLYIYKLSFLYSYQIVRYLCETIYLHQFFFIFIFISTSQIFLSKHLPLPIHPCLYRADFFIFGKQNSCQVYVHVFINQESLVPSISKRKRESENQPYNKTTWRPTMAATNLFKRERSHIYPPRVLILHVCVHNAPQSRVVRIGTL